MARKTPRSRWPTRLAALTFGLVIFWGIPELVVRAINPPLGGFRQIVFGDVETSPKLFVKDVVVGWSLRPSADVRFLSRRVRINSSGNRGDEVSSARAIVLCLGDSTTFGWGVGQSESFAARLEDLLANDARTKDRWQVVNAGVPAHSSYQVRLRAEDLIPRLRPSVVVVCTGNNEAWPVERPDREVYGTKKPWTIAAARLLGSSHFLAWLAETVLPDRTREYRAPPAALAVPRVSREDTRANLEAVRNLSANYGARMIVVSPTVNLYHPPIDRELLRVADTLDHRAEPNAPPPESAQREIKRWKSDLSDVNQALDAGRAADAIAQAERLRAGAPDDFRYLWLEGVARCADGQRAAGRVLLETAFEQHPFPDRCKPSYIREIERFAKDFDIRYVDANALFEKAAGDGLPLGFYSDWCHPSVDGHALIANALFDLVVEAPLNDATPR